MYLDTLKVSTLEQSASETFARGGLGNANLIGWDFGKEISLNLQDALFTPASQSLMWGGKYGIQKPQIFGVFNPYVYPTDMDGREQYLRRVDINNNAVNYTVVDVEGETAWELFVVQSGSSSKQKMDYLKLDNDNKQLKANSIEITRIAAESDGFIINDGDYRAIKSTSTTDSKSYLTIKRKTVVDEETSYVDVVHIPFTNAYPYIQFNCPCDGDTKGFVLIPNEGEYQYTRKTDHTIDQLDPTVVTCPSGKDLYESQEEPTLITKYDLVANELDKPEKWANSDRPEMSSIKIDKFGTFDYSIYSLVQGTVDEQDVCYYEETTFCDASAIKCTDETADAFGYTWVNSDALLSSFEKSQVSYYLDNANIRFRVSAATGYREIGLSYAPTDSDVYSSKLDVYKTITQKYTDTEGLPQEVSMKVKVGTFYVVNDWNTSNTAPQEFAYLIDSGLQNVDILESMVEVRAEQTFAIDADKNLRCNNYRYDKDYSHNALTVFINPRTMQPYEANTHTYTTRDGVELSGNFTIIKQNEVYYKWTRKISDGLSSLGHRIVVDAKHYPGTFKIVGETLARSRYDGQDEKYQFEIPLCKLSPNTNITLEAAGDPTTFSMSFTVLRKDDGTMVKLTQYNESNSVERLEETGEIPEWSGMDSKTVLGKYRAATIKRSFNLVNPNSTTIQYADSDEDAPLDGTSTGHVDKADQEYLDSITTTSTRTWPQGSTEADADVVLTNQTITSEGEESLATNIDKVVVEELSTIQLQQQKDVVYLDGTVVHTDEWVDVDDPVVTTKYLTPEEYALEAKAEASS